MLSILQPQNLVDVRNEFCEHPLFIAIQDACCDICRLSKKFQFRPEHVFIETLTLLDNLKEDPKNTDWSRLDKLLKDDYRFLDSDIPNNELCCIAAIIDCSLASILVLSIPRFYHQFGESLLQQAFAHDNEVPREALYELCDVMEKHETQLIQWFDEYMESNEFTSDEFLAFYQTTDMPTAKGTPEHIKFVPTASALLRDEFKAVLKNAITDSKKWGKAGRVKRHLANYRDEDVIELYGSEKDIYDDLCYHFGYTQDIKSFYHAKPKLART